MRYAEPATGKPNAADHYRYGDAAILKSLDCLIGRNCL
jgi:hypothetical protein